MKSHVPHTSIPADGDSYKLQIQIHLFKARRGHRRRGRKKRTNRETWMLIVCALIGLVILSSAIAFAIYDLDFRQNMFYPIVDGLIIPAIAGALSYLIKKLIK